jgi:excisionase family DNA binding protein
MAHALADPIVPTREDAARAKAAQVALERSEASGAALNVQLSAAGKETTLDLPPLVTEMLKDILKALAAGKAVSLVPVEAEITTQQAATILNVSRPYLVGMVEKGLLPARMVGNQRRLPLQDVLAYKADNRAKRKAVLDEMAALDQELGLI